MTKGSRDQNIWDGIYLSYEDLISKGKAFTSERWLTRITDQLLDYRNDVKRKNSASVLPPRISELPIIAGEVCPKSIIDFGGSSAWAYEYLKNSLPRLSLDSYLVIEIPEIVRYMNDQKLHQPPVSFQTATKEMTSVDILYTNSVLQYLPDDLIFTNLIKSTKPKYILIEDFIGGRFNDYFTIQNYYESRIPVKFRNRDKFINLITIIGYEIIVSKPYPSIIQDKIVPFPMDNFPDDKQVSYSETLLFKRIETRT